MKRYVTVTQVIEIEVDESKFTDEFIEDFKRDFYPFETVEDHICHLAQLEARGLYEVSDQTFVEGYGPVSNFGVAARPVDIETEIEPQKEREVQP